MWERIRQSVAIIGCLVVSCCIYKMKPQSPTHVAKVLKNINPTINTYNLSAKAYFYKIKFFYKMQTRSMTDDILYANVGPYRI